MAADLIPLFSYLWLRGRCRYCHAAIPRRTLAVELATGLAFSLLYWHFGVTALLGAWLVYASIYLIVFVIDLEHMLVLDKVVYPGMALALAFSFLPDNTGVLKAIEGGALGLSITLALFLVFSGGLGFGDVKLGALVGLSVGFPEILAALFLTVVGGGIVAIGLLVSGVKRRKDPIPFAPFFAVAAVLTLVWGQQVVHWYQHSVW
jgi:leader peptidase (prepilin peptidase)/N-methyltransferase